MANPSPLFTLPPTPKPSASNKLNDYQQSVAVWTRQAQQILKSVAENSQSGATVSVTAPLTETDGVIGIPEASALQDGYLSAADWSLFMAGSSLSATLPLIISGGVLSLPQSSGSQDGFLDSADWTTFNTGATEAAAALPATKQTRSVVLCAAYSPGAVGADTAEVEIPYDTTGASLTFSITRILLRVQTAGGAPSVSFEQSSGTGAFSPTAIGTVTLSSGANEGQVTSGLGTITSGSKVRFNVLTLATAANWVVQMDIAAN